MFGVSEKNGIAYMNPNTPTSKKGSNLKYLRTIETSKIFNLGIDLLKYFCTVKLNKNPLK